MKIIFLDIDDVLFDTAHYKESNLIDYRLYDEVLAVVTQLQKIGEVGILSQGEHAFQTKKLIETGIHDMFVKEHIHIVEKKDESLEKVLHKYKNVSATMYFIDDRLTGLYFAKKALPSLIAIWLKRGRYAEGQEEIEGFKPDFIVKTLHEVIPIISPSPRPHPTLS